MKVEIVVKYNEIYFYFIIYIITKRKKNRNRKLIKAYFIEYEIK